MDIQQLCAVLQGCLSANPEERKAAEALLKQVLLDALQLHQAALTKHTTIQQCLQPLAVPLTCNP